MTSEVHIPKILSCLLTLDKETGRWNGHCLDFDIVTSGVDEDEAWQNLKAVVRLHVEECFNKWPDGLKRTASQERWNCFRGNARDQVNDADKRFSCRLTIIV